MRHIIIVIIIPSLSLFPFVCAYMCVLLALDRGLQHLPAFEKRQPPNTMCVGELVLFLPQALFLCIESPFADILIIVTVIAVG